MVMMKSSSFWLDIRLFVAVAAVLLISIVFYNQYIAALGIILLSIVYFEGRNRYIKRQKALTEYLGSLTKQVDQASCYALQHLPVAMAMIDSSGTLLWRNKLMVSWGNGQADVGQPIQGMWPSLIVDHMIGKSGMEILHHGNRHYQIIYCSLEQNDSENKQILLYATDITASETVQPECHESMPVLAYIQIDNYGDVLQGLTDNQRTAIVAEVNRRLVEWVSAHESFLKKHTDDMYLALFSRQALTKLLVDKFDILDHIRDIHGGNKIPVTLSIGVAADEVSPALLGQRAQAGLDLALSRGGDQVAVNLQGEFRFYGGKAKSVEKSTRVRARIVAQAIRESIESAKIVVIMGHAGEDFDSLGAALGVAKMARYLNKQTHIVVSQPGMAMEKLLEILPEYTEYAGMFLSPKEALDLPADETLLFVLDTHRPELTAAPELLSRFERIIIIDHHRRAKTFIENNLLVYLEPSASSTSELVAELLMYYDDAMDLNRLEASALYSGIVVDTKNFAVQTGVRTFEAASYLRRIGADPTMVRKLFRVDFDLVKARGEIIQNAEMLPGGALVSICPENVKNAQIVAAQSADMLLNIEGVEVSFVLFPMEGGVGISARSQGNVNVQLIMEELGGGGHQTVAGAQLKDITMEEAKQQVIRLVAKYIEESDQNEINSAARSERSW
ncbi:MAG: phosphoesterase RecJ domain protein [Firmicutes bacterium]|nr:phosphoesterase RecJ domain protein [Bacillota bacterium]